MRLKDALAIYLKEQRPRIDKEYAWPLPKNMPVSIEFPPGQGFSKNLYLRSVLHAKLAENSPESDTIQVWYVRDWGGIKGNKKETLSGYLRKSNEELILLGKSGVASWSKMLTLRDPSRYAIYDARVAMSLNSIQRIYEVSDARLFPQLVSRNSDIIRAQTKIKASGYFKFTYADSDFYKRYLDLLMEASEGVEGLNLQIAEMILFAFAEDLAKEAWPDAAA